VDTFKTKRKQRKQKENKKKTKREFMPKIFKKWIE